MMPTWYFIINPTVIERVLRIVSGLVGFPSRVCCFQDLLRLHFLQLSSTSIEVTLFSFEMASVFKVVLMVHIFFCLTGVEPPVQNIK